MAEEHDILGELVIDVPGVGAMKFRDLTLADHIRFHLAVVERVHAGRSSHESRSAMSHSQTAGSQC